ncbi:MAG TPA: DUF167 domain-containing protein [Candidatus Magasanikbacteria bacterium]|nr:DUF167 domain-containing protein [Candidatus Magasanikbacteria bacterium]
MRITVKVTPRAKKNELKGWRNDILKIGVTAAPEHSRANEAVVRLLAKAAGCAPSEITIIRGKTSREKIIQLPDACAEKLKKYDRPHQKSHSHHL